MEEVLRLYRDELPLSTQSAFATHGLSTFIVLLSGWLAFCAAIDGVASVVDCKKLQPDAATNNPKLRALARRTVARQWAFVLAQAVIFAPLLKAAFPLLPLQTALSPSEYASFFIIWLVSNDFLFTVAHTSFHSWPWLYKFAHKEHHTWKAPFAWMSHAMSYTEATANGLAVMAYPLYHALALRKPTPLQLVWAVQLVAQYIGCIEHSGYDGLHPLIVSPSRFPSWMLSTTRHHDTHHRLMRGNYGGYLKVWDVLMGTAIVEDADGTAAAAAASQSRKQNQRRNPQASRRSPRRAKPKLRTS